MLLNIYRIWYIIIYYIIALLLILSTLQIILHLVRHNPASSEIYQMSAYAHSDIKSFTSLVYRKRELCNFKLTWGSTCSVAANVLDVVSEFELKPHYYVHFRTDTLGKGMNPFTPICYELNCTTTILLQG